jgi:hypothetical protein
MTFPDKPTRFEKRPSWNRIYDFDFTKFREFARLGQTVQSATVTAAPAGELVLGTPAAVGGLVQVRVSGGVAGRIYVVTCRVVTSDGVSTFDMDGVLVVVPNAAS